MPQTGLRQQHRAAERPVLQLCAEILKGQQPRNGYGMPVEIIVDRDDLTMHLREFRFEIAHHLVKKRRSRRAGRDCQKARISVIFGILQRIVEFIHQISEHPDAVLILRIALVGLVLRQRQSGKQIQLIGCIDDAAAVRGKAPALHGFDLLDRRPRRFLRECGNRTELFAEFRHAERHDRDALDCRHHAEQIGERLMQIVAVIPCRAEDDLTVHRHAGIGHAAKIFQRFTGFFVAEHFIAQQRIGRLHGDIDRHMHFDDAVNILVGEVGQRDIAALQKGEPGIVILEIDRIPHPLRILVDEAENAVIAAGALFVHERSREAEAGVLIFALAQADLLLGAVPQEAHGQVLCGDGKAIIQHIMDHGIIDRDQAVAGADARFVSRRSGDNIGDLDQSRSPSFHAVKSIFS